MNNRLCTTFVRFIPLLLASGITCGLQLLSTWLPLTYNRSAILAGDWWRLLTGGWLHHNMLHLLMNLAALSLIWVLISRYRTQWCCLLLLGGQVLLADVALLVMSPGTEYYWGLSAALHGLFALAAMDLIRHRDSQGWWWLLGLVGKLVWDTFHADSWTSELIATRVHYQSHWFGAMSGVGVGLLLMGWQRIAKRGPKDSAHDA